MQNVKICINGTVTNEVLQEQDVSENGTETELEQPEQTPAEGTQEVPASDINNVSEDYTEILVAQRSGNEILGKMYAVQIFFLALLLCILMYLIIKNNSTKYF